MKQFQADNRLASTRFKKYKSKAALYLLLIVPFLCFEVMYNYHKHHSAVYILLFAIFSFGLFGLFIFSIYNGVMQINRILNKIEIDSTQIVFETFDTSMFFNLVKKDSRVVSAERNQIIFSLSSVQYGFDIKYTGDIYLLNYGGNEYLIPEIFFDRFYELKNALENSNQ